MIEENECTASSADSPFIFEVEGLDSVHWHELTHAYGSAADLPNDLRRLVSSDSEVRAKALWELFGSIYHQGTIYPATAAALPFLIRLASDRRTPDRIKIWQLLDAIAESSAIDPDLIFKTWARRRELFGETYSKPSEEMAANEISTMANVHCILLDNMSAIRDAAFDPQLAEVSNAILQRLRRGQSAL